MSLDVWANVFLYCEPSEYLQFCRVCKCFDTRIRQQRWWKVLDLRNCRTVEEAVSTLQSSTHKDDLENVLLPAVGPPNWSATSLDVYRFLNSIGHCLRELRLQMGPSDVLEEGSVPEDGDLSLTALRVLSVRFRTIYSRAEPRPPWNVSRAARSLVCRLRVPRCDTLEVRPSWDSDAAVTKAQWALVSLIVSSMKSLATLKVNFAELQSKSSGLLGATAEVITSLLTNQHCVLGELRHVHLVDWDAALIYSCVLERLVVVADGMSVIPVDVRVLMKAIIARVRWSVTDSSWTHPPRIESRGKRIMYANRKLQNSLSRSEGTKGEESEQSETNDDDEIFHEPRGEDEPFAVDGNESKVEWTNTWVEANSNELDSLYRVGRFVVDRLVLSFDNTVTHTDDVMGATKSLFPKRCGVGAIVLPYVSRLRLRHFDPFDTQQCEIVRCLKVGSPHRPSLEVDVELSSAKYRVSDTTICESVRDAMTNLIASFNCSKTSKLRVTVASPNPIM